MEDAFDGVGDAPQDVLPSDLTACAIRDRDGRKLASLGQRSLWLVEQLHPGTAEYVVPLALRLTGTMDRTALAGALSDVMRRHEVLRSRLVEHEGDLVQVLDALEEDVEITPAVGDLHAIARAEARRPFDLARDPLVRATLIDDDGACVLLLVMHHSVIDNWSAGILVSDLGAAYAARTGAELGERGLPPLALQYADFAAWQRSRFEGGALEFEMDYWRERLSGIASGELQPDRARPAVWSPQGDVVSLVVPARVARSLENLGRQQRATPFMVYLAALKVLLARYAMAEDIAVGTSVAGRVAPETEKLIGYFVNTLVLRTRVDPSATFEALLDAVRDTVLEALAHQETPFESLVQELAPDRQLAKNPFFQVMFLLQNTGATDSNFDVGDLAGEFLHLVHEEAKFDLSWTLQARADGSYVLDLVYASALFDRATALRLAEGYVRILASVAGPGGRDRPIGEVPLLSQDERAALTAPSCEPQETRRGSGWQTSGAPLVHEAFAEAVLRAPDAVALTHDDLDATYRQLDGDANRLAHRLRALGVGPESRVAILMERSPRSVVAVIGILKAGGAYVPLDIRSPQARIAAVLTGSGAIAVVADTAHRSRVEGVPAVVLDEPGALDTYPSGPLEARVSPDNLAYVLHTSGSTGQPKGVGVTHAGIANMVAWAVREHAFGPGERVLHRTALSFDAAGWEMFAPLTAGGRVILAPVGADRDPGVLCSVMKRHGVTVAQLVPSLAGSLPAEFAECTTLRLVFCGGEALPLPLAARLRALTGATVVNVYGPTECSVNVSSWKTTAGDNDRSGTSAPIGLPVAGIGLLVLDRALAPVPVGAIGELCVSGIQVARGYVGRPALTAERFLPNPHSGRPGDRLYRTGDLVIRRADGVLLFVGRADQQVKVRGYRIEPEEVSAALLAHPAVVASVVLAHGEGSARGLVAYVVASDADTALLSRHLEQRLPPYMQPAWWIRLPVLPLTASGKVDRAALPKPGDAGSEAAKDVVPPEDDRQALVAAIWGEVLAMDVTRISTSDDFFRIGGNSLQAVQVLRKLRELGFNAGDDVMRLMFEEATPAAVAAALSPADRGFVDAPPAADGGRAVSFAQERLWFLEALRPGTAEYVVPMAVRLTGALDLEALRRSLDLVVARHEALRTRLRPADGTPVPLVDPAAPLHLELTSNATETVLDAVSTLPFSLQNDWPIRAYLVPEAPDRHVLVLVMHHVATDGWSADVLLRDLGLIYGAVAAGLPPELPVLSLTYGDYCAWQRSAVGATAARRGLDYWRGRLAGASALEMPTDRPRLPDWDPSGSDISVELPSALTTPVLELARRRGATPFMVFLSVFQILLRRYSGQTDIVIGTPVSGRGEPGTEDLVGLFVNTVVLREELDGRWTFEEALERARKTVLGALIHQDTPFEKVVETLAPDRDLSRNPLFQVMFEVHESHARDLRIGGLQAAQIPVDNRTAKFDMAWTLLSDPDGRYRVSVQYANSLYNAATIRRMVGHFENFLEAVVAQPGSAIDNLEMLTDQERQHILRQSAGLPAPPISGYVHERIAEQAARNPALPALVDGDDTITYGALDRRANAFAHLLREHGVGPSRLVAVAMRRGPDVVVALLGVLKAGGTYVPLDLQHPVERIAEILEDTGATVVVTDCSSRDRLPSTDAVVLQLDALDLRDGKPLPPAVGVVAAAQSAYVIFTSGSTGRPKGVAISHLAYAHHCEVISGPYEIGPHDRVLLLSALTFDPAMDQIGATLGAGATVVFGDAAAWSATQLLDNIYRHRVTTVEITPAHYREVMQDVRQGDERLANLKIMNVGSDVVTWDDVRLWQRSGAPGTFLCNYGPTETTVTCTLYTVQSASHERDSQGSSVPIGVPVPGTEAYVVDERLNLVPVGVPGELLIGGQRTGTGYLNRPGLTAERFIPNLFAATPGTRLYRSGDLVRRQSNGALAFLGRLDRQVKVRGFRIELGEVEAAVGRHPGVRAVAVTAYGEGAQRGLAAYLVAGTDPPPVEELRSFVSAKLPDCMVPSWWIEVPALPLNSSGKVDRRALPAPEGNRPRLSGAYVAPANETEEVIAGIWADVLALEKVGVHDDFFDLGGHSLLATRLLARSNAAFDVELSLRILFDAPTVSRYAMAVHDAIATQLAEMSPDEIAASLQSNEEAL